MKTHLRRSSDIIIDKHFVLREIADNSKLSVSSVICDEVTCVAHV